MQNRTVKEQARMIKDHEPLGIAIIALTEYLVHSYYSNNFYHFLDEVGINHDRYQGFAKGNLLAGISFQDCDRILEKAENLVTYNQYDHKLQRLIANSKDYLPQERATPNASMDNFQDSPTPNASMNNFEDPLTPKTSMDNFEDPSTPLYDPYDDPDRTPLYHDHDFEDVEVVDTDAINTDTKHANDIHQDTTSNSSSASKRKIQRPLATHGITTAKLYESIKRDCKTGKDADGKTIRLLKELMIDLNQNHLQNMTNEDARIIIHAYGADIEEVLNHEYKGTYLLNFAAAMNKPGIVKALLDTHCIRQQMFDAKLHLYETKKDQHNPYYVPKIHPVLSAMAHHSVSMLKPLMNDPSFTKQLTQSFNGLPLLYHGVNAELAYQKNKRKTQEPTTIRPVNILNYLIDIWGENSAFINSIDPETKEKMIFKLITAKDAGSVCNLLDHSQFVLTDEEKDKILETAIKSNNGLMIAVLLKRISLETILFKLQEQKDNRLKESFLKHVLLDRTINSPLTKDAKSLLFTEIMKTNKTSLIACLPDAFPLEKVLLELIKNHDTTKITTIVRNTIEILKTQDEGDMHAPFHAPLTLEEERALVAAARNSKDKTIISSIQDLVIANTPKRIEDASKQLGIRNNKGKGLFSVKLFQTTLAAKPKPIAGPSQSKQPSSSKGKKRKSTNIEANKRSKIGGL